MGLKLKLKRIEKGFKQCELAEKIGVSRYSLSALERGKVKNPNLKVVSVKSIPKIGINDFDNLNLNCQIRIICISKNFRYKLRK